MSYALCQGPQAVSEQFFVVWQPTLSCWGTNVIRVCRCHGGCALTAGVWVDRLSQLAFIQSLSAEYCTAVRW